MKTWIRTVGRNLGMAGAGALGMMAAEPADVQRTIEQWVGEKPGGVAVARVDANGATFFNAGKLAAADPRPVTADTQFEIGSVTKVFTAVLFADAARAGKVQPDQPVGAPFGTSAITYEQLATHTSGLPRLPPGMAPRDPANPYAEETLAALVQAFDVAAAKATPTSRAEYSNFGFAVLGQAVARADGASYDAALRTRVLGPLGLRDTVLSWREADPTRLAPGHSDGRRVANWDLAAMTPAGGLVSTTRDLAVFLQDCLGLRETSLTAVLAATARPRVLGPGAGRRHGWAWVVEQRGGTTIVWHNGGTGGYRSFVGYDASARIGIAVLTNHTASVDELGMALLTGAAVGKGTPAAVTADEAKAYAGNYPFAPSFVIAVTADAEGLALQATQQPKLRLKRLAADRFAVEGVAAEVTFERGADGAVAALVLHQNGMNQRAPRLAPGVLPAGPKEIALSAAELEEYVGGYQLGPATFTVKRDGERLLVQLSGQPFFPVFASAKDEFFYKVVNAQLSFERGADGRVVALVLHQHGANQRAEKIAR